MKFLHSPAVPHMRNLIVHGRFDPESANSTVGRLIRAEPRVCGADGRVTPGGTAETVPEMAAAVGSICASRLMEAGDTRPCDIIQRDTLPCVVRHKERMKINSMNLSLDGPEFRGTLGSFVAGKHYASVEEKAVLENRRNDKNKARNASNAHIGGDPP